LKRLGHHGGRHRPSSCSAGLRRGACPGCRRDNTKSARKVSGNWYFLSYRDCRRTRLAEKWRRLVLCRWSSRGRAKACLGHSCRTCGRFVQTKGRRYSLEVEAKLVHRRYEGSYYPAWVGAFRRETHGSNSLRDR